MIFKFRRPFLKSISPKSCFYKHRRVFVQQSTKRSTGPNAFFVPPKTIKKRRRTLFSTRLPTSRGSTRKARLLTAGHLAGSSRVFMEPYSCNLACLRQMLGEGIGPEGPCGPTGPMIDNIKNILEVYQIRKRNTHPSPIPPLLGML